jgi:hypothetical protein
MGSLQERIVAYANLLALSKELDQLRERVKKAEKLCAASKRPKQRPASFHPRVPTHRVH